MTPTLLYAEVPCFYAEVERALDPRLRDRPVIVGGNPRKRGLVQAACPAALGAGVRVGMPLLEALEHCPRARPLRTNMRRYRETSAQLRSSLRRVIERLEPVGLDAAYLDASELSGSSEVLARELRTRVAEELRLPLRVGIAPVKFLARLAAEEAGAQGVRQIAPGEVSAFLRVLPVERLPGVGPKTAGKLVELGAVTAGEVVALGREPLERALGNHGLAILGYAMGHDANRLRVAGHARSVSHESTLDGDELDLAALDEGIQELARRLEESLRRDELAARRVSLKVRYADQETTTRTRTVRRAVVNAEDIASVAAALLRLTLAGTRPVRLLGVSLASLVRGHREEPQLDLFRPEDS